MKYVKLFKNFSSNDNYVHAPGIVYMIDGSTWQGANIRSDMVSDYDCQVRINRAGDVYERIYTYNGVKPSNNEILYTSSNGHAIIPVGSIYDVDGKTLNISSNTLDSTINMYRMVYDNDIAKIGSTAFTGNPLVKIIFPDSVTSICDGAFINCSALTEVIMPNTVNFINNTTNESAIFKNCTSLKSIVLSTSITTLGIGIFENCTSLKNISIPSAVTTLYNGSFANCKKLSNISIPSSVTFIDSDAFSGCTNINTISINSQTLLNDTTTGSGIYRWLESSESNIKKCIIGEDVTILGEYSLENCKFKSISLPSTLTTINSNAFLSCQYLETINIPSSVTTIASESFCYCASLREVTINENTTFSDDSFSNLSTGGNLYYLSEDGTAPELDDEMLSAFFGWTLYVNGEEIGIIISGSH